MNNNSDLKSKAISGSLWAIVENFSLQFFQLIVGIILARLLDPKEFGLIALTGIFTGVAAAISDGGFEKTLIRKKDISTLQINTVFYTNALFGLILTVISLFSAPYIGRFFNEPRISELFAFVSLGFFITSLGQIQRILLMKELKFKKISLAQLISSVIGGILGIVLAYNGFGVWALAYSAFATQVIRVLVYWFRAEWYPQFVFSIASIKEMIPYGSNILVSSVLLFLLQQFNNFVIGKFFSKSQLGLFNRGSKLPELTVTLIQSVVLKMTFPLLSKLQEDKGQLVLILHKITGLVAFVAIPMSATLFIAAKEITIFLYTSKWAGSIIFMQLMCIAKVLEPFISVQREVILINGNSKLLLKIFTISSIIEIALILFVIQYGILYVLYVTILNKILQFLAYSITSANILKIKKLTQLYWILPYILITSLMIITVYLAELVIIKSWTPSIFMMLTIKLASAAASYLFFAYIFKLKELKIINTSYKVLTQNLKKTNLNTQSG